MPNRFNGLVNIDIRDSTPDWSRFEPPRAPDRAPNVVYIVLDDVGFSALDSHGGPIPTPTSTASSTVAFGIPSGTQLRCAPRHGPGC